MTHPGIRGRGWPRQRIVNESQDDDDSIPTICGSQLRRRHAQPQRLKLRLRPIHRIRTTLPPRGAS
jgi:hypothetical protein